ncbi:hypothetical protein OB236_35050 [Paenibacillus sp. WQ 127069]|uniref:Peptidylprolyl isomerase n=1 Tax=Paenibacillus baimaensis TaxID=2982185 RepID=A0ABT2URR9_9BACL|nr:hypothetical protein [Paenibacillus sp. WQ 127069]MCU6797359.1 hypothetical protein [Paenibacillus sp. WQ 127069]
MRQAGGRILICAIAILVSAIVCTGYISWQHTERGNSTYSSNLTSPTVAYINGAVIEEREFNLFLSQVKAQVTSYFKQKFDADDSSTFWTTSFQGEVPIIKAKQLALEQIKQVKVQQLLAQQFGLLEDTSYSSFLDKWAKENQRRQEAVANNRVIYGPRQYEEWGYYTYVQSTMIIQLKAVMNEREEAVSEQELINLYEQLKGKLYQEPGERKAGSYIPYSEVKDSVKQRLIDANYDARVKQELEAAKVVVMEPIYQQIQMQ